MHIQRILKEVVIDQADGGTDDAISEEVDIGAWRIAGIIMPGTWTSASITFKMAEESGGTFVDVYDDAGNELALTADASQFIALTGDDSHRLSGVRWIKVRSGTAATPVDQTTSRTLQLVLVRP